MVSTFRSIASLFVLFFWQSQATISTRSHLHSVVQHDTGMPSTRSEYQVGNFHITVDESNSVPTILVVHISNPNKVVWKTIAGNAFLRAAKGEANIEENRGLFNVNDHIIYETDGITITEMTFDSTNSSTNHLTISGELLHTKKNKVHVKSAPISIAYAFVMHSVPGSSSHLAFSAKLFDRHGEEDLNTLSYNRIFLSYHTTADEKFYGFGEQFTFLNMKGRAPTIITSENGIGRGEKGTKQSKTLLKIMTVLGANGSFDSSYSPAPYYLTSQGRSVFLENYEISVFDLVNPNRVTIKVLANEMKGRILYGHEPLDLIQSYTEYTGRMIQLPDWINQGAIVGFQGGTGLVREAWRQLQILDTPIAAFWLQDWVGNRQTVAGTQLWWNWVLNEHQYPQWPALVSDLESSGIRVMTYINPFFADLSAEAGYDGGELLFGVGEAAGYFVKNAEGETILIPNTDFSAAILDISNPDARTWMKGIIKDNLIASGASGWMCDFGEALPFDSVLASGESPETFHNKYPEEWTKLNEEAIQEAGRTGDIVFFSRSGFTKTPESTTLMWEGDQQVLWDENDGLKSAITGLLSAGLSGLSLIHSDIGGYFSVELLNITRSRELFDRWAEMNAFTAIYRSHQGIQPNANIQFNTDERTLFQFSKFAKVYAALAFYRRSLLVEASTLGYPVVRHTFLHYPDDPVVYDLNYQWLLGSVFVVVPVTDSGETSVKAYLPSAGSNWKHIWTGDIYASGSWYTIDAPIGQPAVFFEEGSEVGETFLTNLQDVGVMA